MTLALLVRVQQRGVAQFGRAPGLGPGGRRFESCHPELNFIKFLVCGCSSMVEHQPSKLDTWVRFPSPAFVLKMFIFDAKDKHI